MSGGFNQDKPSTGKHPRSSDNGRQQQQKAHKGNNGQKAAGGSSGGAGPSGKPGPTDRTIDTANGTVTRNTDIIGFCRGKHLCVNCYRPGHDTAKCTAPTKAGNPQGFVPRKQ